MMGLRVLILGLAAVSVLVSGCAKDQSVEEYQNKQMQEDLAKLASVDGVYRGAVISKQTGQVIGALQMTLHATTDVLNSNSQTKDSLQPVLDTDIIFQANSQMEIDLQTGTYSPDSGTFEADVNLGQPGQSSGQTSGQCAGSGSNQQCLTVHGLINGGTLTGYIQAMGFSKYGAQFTLTKNGPTLAEVLRAHKPQGDDVFAQADYTGTTKFQGNVSKPVNLNLLRPKTSSAQDFLTLLVPVKPVLVTLNYGSSARLQFDSGSWDQETGILTAQKSLTLNSQNLQISLNCTQTTAGGFNCKHYVTGTSGVIALSSFTPAQGSVEDPPDDPTTRETVTRLYNGKIQDNPNTWEDVVMTVRYMARTRLQEIYDLLIPQNEETLRVSWAFTNTGVNAGFPSALWDLTDGTLEAEAPNVQPGALQSLSCQNFHFDQIKSKNSYNFTCQYVNGLGWEPQMIFKSN